MDERLKSKEIERQIIEKELQRQRMMAISGRTSKTGTDAIEKSSHPREIIRLKREVQEEKAPKKRADHTMNKLMWLKNFTRFRGKED